MFIFHQSQGMEADLRAFLEKQDNYKPDWPILIQVDEISQILRIRGNYLEEAAAFLQETGM